MNTPSRATRAFHCPMQDITADSVGSVARPAVRHKPISVEWPHLLAVATALLLLYLFTAPRTVVLEDDGLFILSSWFLGIEHPPGYPLFILLGKLATLLPFGSGVVMKSECICGMPLMALL